MFGQIQNFYGLSPQQHQQAQRQAKRQAFLQFLMQSLSNPSATGAAGAQYINQRQRGYEDIAYSVMQQREREQRARRQAELDRRQDIRWEQGQEDRERSAREREAEARLAIEKERNAEAERAREAEEKKRQEEIARENRFGANRRERDLFDRYTQRIDQAVREGRMTPGQAENAKLDLRTRGEKAYATLETQLRGSFSGPEAAEEPDVDAPLSFEQRVQERAQAMLNADAKKGEVRGGFDRYTAEARWIETMQDQIGLETSGRDPRSAVARGSITGPNPSTSPDERAARRDSLPLEARPTGSRSSIASEEVSQEAEEVSEAPGASGEEVTLPSYVESKVAESGVDREIVMSRLQELLKTFRGNEKLAYQRLIQELTE